MRARLANFGLPMLAKELAEMAQRRRTYWIRVAFAGLLFSMSALVCLPEILAAGSAPGGLLGQGRQVLGGQDRIDGQRRGYGRRDGFDIGRVAARGALAGEQYRFFPCQLVEYVHAQLMLGGAVAKRRFSDHLLDLE